jgi:hypothetical protein
MKAQSKVDGKTVDGWSEFFVIEALVHKRFVWFNVHGECLETDWEVVGSCDLLNYAKSERFADWVKGFGK